VISTQIKQIALGDLLIAEADDSQHAMLSNVQTMDVRVEEVLRGNAQPTTITFLIFPPVDLHKSQELVVCAKWIRGRKLSSFVTNPFLGLYEESAAGHWERLVDATSIVPRESFTNEELLKQVQEAGVAKLVAQSDVVASGSITRVWASTYHTDDGRVGELLHYELNVSDLLKGKDSDGALEFVVAKENLSFVPKWFRYTPKGLAVGQDWFVFLKTGERGLYPFAGPNSLLKVEDGRLLFDNAVTYPMDARDVTARVRAEVANAQE